MNIDYKSIADLRLAILKNLYKFPHDVDLIVGIPRSGMLPANLLALYLNKPYTDIDSFIEGRIYGSGERNKFDKDYSINKIIVIDDSIAKGVAINKAKHKIEQCKLPQIEILWAVVYAAAESINEIDIYCEKTGLYRLFEWNLFHHPHFIPHCCCDIDGVLCPNPPIDDDGQQYVDYISKAPVLYRPTRKIDTIVSCRLEKYREITEKWLHINRIEYNKLVMLNIKTKEERIAWGKHGEYKGIIYAKSKNILFIESSISEARTIVKIAKKPVFCTENFEMINDETLSYYVTSSYAKLKKRIKKIIKHNK